MASNSSPPPRSPPHSTSSTSPVATRSPPRPGHARNASVSSQHAVQQHLPSVPSALRQAHMPPPSPDDRRHVWQQEGCGANALGIEDDGIHPNVLVTPPAESEGSETRVQGEIEEPAVAPMVRSRLLDLGHRYHLPHNCGEYNCNHGTFSPRPRYHRGYGSIASNYSAAARENDNRSLNEYAGATPGGSGDVETSSYRGDDEDGSLGERVTAALLGKSSKKKMTNWLARKRDMKSTRWMYVQYYIPCLTWLSQYKLSYLEGDLTAALTMASFYIPIALSLASNLAHIPPINGLYTFVFNPLIYALLGTCPQMVVGPEAAGSLLTGSVVKEAINRGTNSEYDELKHAQVAGMVTGLAGAFIFIAGLCRLGFLDGVLSRPFLRGFISAIGIVILVDQLIPEMGLDGPASHSEAASHGSSLDKILFLFRHGHETHKLTAIVSFSTIAIVLTLRELKRRLEPRPGLAWVAYIPDRCIVVVLSAVFAWQFDWESQGLKVMGDIRSQGRPFKVHFPFDEGNFRHVTDAFSTAFIISLLGFFESSVAAKSLGTGGGQRRRRGRRRNTAMNAKGSTHEEEEKHDEGLKDMPLSANRELVALGVANLLGGLFMALPGFGGYGRSKVNASTGGRTPMSSVFLAIITAVCIVWLLPYFYYIPKGTLSAMISVVAYSLIEEAPHDIRFFLRISGYSELILMTLIFFATFLWNLKIGIAVGIGLSLLRLLRHSTRPRIQILGRVPGTKEFENAELLAGEREVEGLEMVPHCLIVKIPEPLTFANTGSLKDRLRRLEDHGAGSVHPALPKVRRKEHNKNIIFDIHGVTSLDPAAAQVLLEIVQAYVERGTRVFFCRVPGRRTEVWRLMQVSGIVELCGGEVNFLRSVDEALRATERSSTLFFDDGGMEEEEEVGMQRGFEDGDAPGPAPRQDEHNHRSEEMRYGT